MPLVVVGRVRNAPSNYLRSEHPIMALGFNPMVQVIHERDVQHARRNGWLPGGSIMIHGLPNDPRHAPDYYATQDWTDGCGRILGHPDARIPARTGSSSSANDNR